MPNFVVTPVKNSFVLTTTNFVIIVIVTTKLVRCYNQVGPNIYHLFNVWEYWYNKAQEEKYTNISKIKIGLGKEILGEDLF